MKTQLRLTQKNTLKTLSFVGFLMTVLLALNPIYGQSKVNTTSLERTIKGVVSTNETANKTILLADVNVTQKGTNNGTVTNEKGEFTFPTKLKTDDVLIFSYLGLATTEFKIKANTTFIKMVLTEDLVEMIGALNTNKPYKSKRKN